MEEVTDNGKGSGSFWVYLEDVPAGYRYPFCMWFGCKV